MGSQPVDRRGMGENERVLLRALHDSLKGGERGGVLRPALNNIKDRSDQLDNLTDDEVTKAARNLHIDGLVMAEEVFRPRLTLNPTIALTPREWEVLEDMGLNVPEEWKDVSDEIIKLLYDREKSNWDSADGRVWVYRDEIFGEIDADHAVFDRLIAHLEDSGLIAVYTEKSTERSTAFVITEDGAQGYENRLSGDGTKGFE